MRRALRIASIALMVLATVARPSAASCGDALADLVFATTRLGGPDRHWTATAMAREAFPGWAGVRSVIVAASDAPADALVASTLTKVAAGPLLLVEREGVPEPVAEALQQIGSADATLSVIVVGGPSAVSDGCVDELRALLGGDVEPVRVFGKDRYQTAAAVASAVASLAAGTADGWDGTVFVANGEPSFGLFDALSASSAGAATGGVVLYARRDEAPSATLSALASLAASDVVVVGGQAAVSAAVSRDVGASKRWAGADRFGTAAAVAAEVRARGLVDAESAIVARAVVDAVAAGQVSAHGGGPLLLVGQGGVPEPTARFLADADPGIERVLIGGGPAAVPTAVERELQGAPHAPDLIAPRPGSLTGAKAPVTVRTGVNTSQVLLYRGSSLVATKAASPFAEVSFGIRQMPADGTQMRVVAVSSRGVSTATSAQYRRLKYPASTSIVVDKSEFRLYWVRDDVLVKAYPVAIGKPNSETPAAFWRIGAKYYTDPASVYGPRKMRLFRRIGNGEFMRYVYTAYGIHGTNQPWVIGTKASHGCIRMYNRDVLELFPQVPLGTLVQTRE
ncbi:MAG: cell wall-binding repeat-containing protein [Coriobacteriia bacterium]|nr:cell wall-binding repeat-containing protein [Coriobacteriia bacterium]